jgi:hypothetical protein
LYFFSARTKQAADRLGDIEKHRHCDPRIAVRGEAIYVSPGLVDPALPHPLCGVRNDDCEFLKRSAWRLFSEKFITHYLKYS